MTGNANKSQNLKERDNKEQPIKDIFSQRLSDLFIDRDVTARKLAAEIDVSEGILTGYKKAQNAPSVSKLKKIADYFQVSTDYLLGEADCIAPDNEAIHKQIGLSEKAIELLKEDLFNEWFPTDTAYSILSEMIVRDGFFEMLKIIQGMKYGSRDIKISNTETTSYALTKDGYFALRYRILKMFEEIVDDILNVN